MNYFIITFVVMGITFIGMAVGVILSNKELKGSCGGLGRIMGEDCDFCEHKDQCEHELEKKGEEVDLFNLNLNS